MENELLTIDEYDITEDGDTQEVEVPADEVEAEIYAEITEYDMEVEPEETIVVDISESMGWVSGDIRYHDSLLGVDAPNQHPITAISRLREELDEIERLKTIYSNKVNVANYYQWSDASYDEYGYFVSLVPSTSTIKICDGADIFGVVTNEAAFVGGQNADVPRGNSYGLVVTSGLVEVRCELDVEVGDCVVPNTSGYAKKSGANYGYKVLAKETKNGVEYAVIMLGVQADVTDALGRTLNEIGDRVTVNEKNIVSAINVANQAYNKSSESVTVSEEALKKALEAVLNSEGAVEDVDDMKETLASTNVVAAQAKAIAESAATSATSMREEAIDAANGAWSSVNELTRTLGPIASWSEGGVSGADYLVTKMNEGIATTYDIKTVEDDIEVAQNAIVRNGKELYSLMTTIYKYSVGEYSQAYGLTLEEAKSILEVGMIYVPTSHERLASGTKYHEEVYQYTDEEGNAQELTRSFTPGYLYQWGELESGLYGWITVDKNFNQTTEVNTSSMAVYFSRVEIAIGGDNNYGYWYTDGDEIIDIDGNRDTYKPYTLYKWNGDGWLAVATLAGNVSNRATSQVRQTANEVSAEVTNARGSYAGLGARLTNTESEVSSLASWKNGDGEVGEAIIRQEANDDGTASIVISTLQKNASDEIEASASLVLSAKQKEDGTGSFLALDADNINLIAENISLDGYVTFTDLESDSGTTKIHGGNIDTDTLSVNAANITGTLTVKDESENTILAAGDGQVQIGGFTVHANALYTGNKFDYDDANAGVYISTGGIGLGAGKFWVTSGGDLRSYQGYIGGWKISSNYLCSDTGNVFLYAGNESGWQGPSIVNPDGNSIKRIRVGAAQSETLEVIQGRSDYVTAYYFDLPVNLNTITSLTIYGESVNTGGGSYHEVFSLSYPESSNITKSGAQIIVTPTASCDRLRMVLTYMPFEPFCVLDDGSVYLNNVYINPSFALRLNQVCFNDLSAKDYTLNGTGLLGGKWKIGPSTAAAASISCEETLSEKTNKLYIRSGELLCSYRDGAEVRTTWVNIVDTVLNGHSDSRIKNSIESFPENYETLFDALAPKRYKYNDGTSNRYHTGFIAQEVIQAVEGAGLTTQDFAAVCLDFSNDEDGIWRLRRDEFVALNTWQIQKLKTRVAELEEKIDKLEKKLKGENGNGTETTNS